MILSLASYIDANEILVFASLLIDPLCSDMTEDAHCILFKIKNHFERLTEVIFGRDLYFTEPLQSEVPISPSWRIVVPYKDLLHAKIMAFERPLSTR